MKKTTAALIALALLTTMFTGCSSSDSQEQTTTAAAETAAGTQAPTTETTETTPTETEPAETTMSQDEMISKVNQMSELVMGNYSKVTANRLYDEKPMTTGIMGGSPFFNIRVKSAEMIPDVVFEMCPIYLEALEQVGLPSGSISVSSYEKDDKGSIIDETMTAWRSNDGIIGALADAPGGEKVKDCTVDMLYEYFGDRVTPLTAEETADIIKVRLGKKAQGLFHEDQMALLVSTVGGSIAVTVRTYEEFLLPAAAEYAYEVIIPIAEKSELPFSRINAMVYDNDEKGGIVQETMVGWTTSDGEAGTFNSKIEAISDQPMTIDELYDKYGEYGELIEKAKNGERIERP